MNYLKTIVAVLYFLIKGLPEVLAVWRKTVREGKFKSFKEALDMAYGEYKNEPSLENLKALEDLQKKWQKK